MRRMIWKVVQFSVIYYNKCIYTYQQLMQNHGSYTCTFLKFFKACNMPMNSILVRDSNIPLHDLVGSQLVAIRSRLDWARMYIKITYTQTIYLGFSAIHISAKLSCNHPYMLISDLFCMCVCLRKYQTTYI